MNNKVINILEKFTKFSDHWSPKIIAQMNDYDFKIAKVSGDFTWHNHKETDEVFIIIEGKLRIDFRDTNITLNEGELFVVPKGIDHKPFAEKECKILIIEPKGIINTGNAGGYQTAEDDVWI